MNDTSKNGAEIQPTHPWPRTAAPPSPQGQQVQVDPIECARMTMMFLQRAQFNAQERRAFDTCEAFLAALIDKRLVIGEPRRDVPAPIAAHLARDKKRREKFNGATGAQVGVEPEGSAAPQSDMLTE